MKIFHFLLECPVRKVNFLVFFLLESLMRIRLAEVYMSKGKYKMCLVPVNPSDYLYFSLIVQWRGASPELQYSELGSPRAFFFCIFPENKISEEEEEKQILHSNPKPNTEVLHSYPSRET